MGGSVVNASTRFSSDVENFLANYTGSAPKLLGLSSAFMTDSDTARRPLWTKSFSSFDYRKALRNIRICYTLIAFGFLTIIGSLVPAM